MKNYNKSYLMANIECNLKFIICIFKTMIFQVRKNSPDGADNTGRELGSDSSSPNAPWPKG